jgi:hypothetical protein
MCARYSGGRQFDRKSPVMLHTSSRHHETIDIRAGVVQRQGCPNRAFDTEAAKHRLRAMVT